MLSERLIPFVALDVSASRVQVRCGAQPGVHAGDAVLMVVPNVCCRRASPFTHTAPRVFLLPTMQEGKKADLPVYFGDAGSPAVLHAVGADKAACAVSHGAWRWRDLGADLLHDCAMSLCRAWRIPTAAGL